MKKRKLFLTLIVLSLFLLVFTLPPVKSQALSGCDLKVSLINQDPYPVIPGDYVEVVFQVSGVENSDCEGAQFKINEDYPFSIDPGQSNKKEISGSTFVSDYKKAWMIPYQLRVDEDAMDGMNEIKVNYASGKTNDLIFSENFEIKVEDVRVDFEISVKEYDPSTNTLTFEILNTGEHDIEALTIDISEQENLDIKGSPRKIVGSLDSNEETTFDFEAVPNKGDIDLEITYTDEISERRSLNKTVYFNPDHFKSSQDSGDGKMSFWFYVVLVLVAYMVFRAWKKRNKQKRHKKSRKH